MFEIHPVKKVSVVIPVYNEQESLPELIRRTTTACESLGKEYEILLIDDGSSDNSAHMLVEASQAETTFSDYGGIQSRYWRLNYYP